MSDIETTIAEAKQIAELAGCTVIEGSERVLLIDFDGTGQNQYSDLRPKLDELFGIVSEERWPSRSGEAHHEHMIVTLNTALTAAERVALQAACGSDPMRELLAVRRLKLNIAEPSLLFKPKHIEPPQQLLLGDGLNFTMAITYSEV